MSLSNSNKRVYRQFYEKTGIQLTDEPLPPSNKAVHDELEELYNLAPFHPRKALPRLEKLILDYPDIPQIKNYLQVCYVKTNQLEKAKAIQERTIKEHPSYIFGVFNAIMNLHTKEELEKQAHLLGNPRHIHTLTGERLVHDSEFINYQIAAAHFESLTEDTDSATKRLDTLIEIEANKQVIKDVAKKIAAGRMLEITNSISKLQSTRIVAENFPKVAFTPTIDPPKLKLSELELFYEVSINDMDTDIVAEIMLLPKEDLVADFEGMIEDSIHRFGQFEIEGYDEDACDFVIHALYFLGALKSERSLDKVLNLLRMGNDFMDFWFGDRREEFFHPVLYSLGEQQLGKLKAFVVEDNIDGFNRLLAAHTVAQIALHQPNRRTEVIDWFKNVYTFHLDHPTNKNIIDTDFLASSVGCVMDFRGEELIPVIAKMYENKWVPDNIQGNIEEITKAINEAPHPSELDPMPENIVEYYTGEYRNRRAERPPISEEDQKIFNKALGETPAEKLVTEFTMKMMMPMFSEEGEEEYMDEDEHMDRYFFDDDYDDYEYVQPVKQVIRAAPKVGRNDPCPCGSGKKYKKCCLRK